MPHYEVKWGAFGIAMVEADDAKEAAQLVSHGAFNFDDIDFDRNDVDGVDIVEVEEVS